MTDVRQKFTGSCLCHGVQFEFHGPARPIVACHCIQCRKTSGNFVAATAVWRDGFRMLREDTLAWYSSSDDARRGFCSRCGASLFWDLASRDVLGVMAGSIDGDTGLRTEAHIFAADKGDFYEIGDDAPRFDGHDHCVVMPEKVD